MTPRGIRNNNPLNIRVGNAWLGEVPCPTDKEFEQFVSMKYGLRAALILIRRYILRYQLCTITDIVSRWAPSSENHTAKYIAVVSERMGISPLKHFAFSSREIIVNLVCAMAYVENGVDINREEVVVAYQSLLWEKQDNLKL